MKRSATCVGVLLSLGLFGHSEAAAPAMSPIARLLAEEQIKQKIALFALLADGDGVTPKDMRTLAEQTLAPDVVTDVYMADGKLASHTTSSAQIVDMTPPAQPNRPVGGRHFVESTYFDQVTPNTARTRTTALYVEVTKNPGPGCETLGPDGCGGRLTHAVTLVYHDTWSRSAKGWVKTRSELRRDN